MRQYVYCRKFLALGDMTTIRARLLIAEDDTMRKISGLKKISKGVYEYNGVEIVQHGRKDWRYEISQGNEGQSESLEQSIVDLESEMYLRRSNPEPPPIWLLEASAK